MIIATKQEMYKLLNAGQLGNALPAFSNVSDLARVYGRKGRFGIRTAEGLGGSGVFVGDLTFGCLVKELLTTFKGKSVNITPMMNKKHYVMHGELMGDYLEFSTLQLHKREAMGKSMGVVTGHSSTRLVLKDYMDMPSYKNVRKLQELYPDHVIEFTVTNRNYGLYRWNTIIWEVRQY